MILLTVGAAGWYSSIVVLIPVLQEFDVSRSMASIPYMSTMIGFGFGGILMGRISDRIGVMLPVLFGGVSMGTGFYIASLSTTFLQLSLVHGVLIGFFGMSTTFAPLVADISHWFNRRRGIAVAIVISGSYVAGAIWPPTIQHHFDTIGWRDTYLGLAWICFAAMTIFGFLLYKRFGGNGGDDVNESPETSKRPLGYSSGRLQSLLCVAGIGCCAAMAMPQVHIIAHAVDLGFSAMRGAEMLALMLGCGVVSRLASGVLSDRFGGIRTLLLGSGLQAAVLVLFLPVDTLTGLYLVSALFGLSQGGIVPSYVIIVRTYFDPGSAGERIGTVLLFTMIGMALGGWIAGALYDLTGSYDAAIVNAIAFNIMNMVIAGMLLRRVVAVKQMSALGHKRTFATRC